MSSVIAFEEFDVLSREDKIDLLKEMRLEVPEKVIREAWGMEYKKFYMYLYHLGLKGGEGNPATNPTAAKSAGRPRKTEEQKAADKAAKQKANQDQVSNGRKIIEAEFSVVPDQKAVEQEISLALAQTAAAATESVAQVAAVQSEAYMRREFTGSPESIVKRLAAISGMLELEDFDMVLKIEVYKA